ncbi:DUF4129 domain-containing protein [Allorhodopirellula solitaria]|uniref:Protein-glutamine gamma-glutamyltransferase-like C-terminal domain-containing protein n=1 Tax=Allorhodopirellula solitaria TaxID=2527987 RepID=A0A5C5XVW4_9BACT|nr:DUF4129 domain-containing protein [Allorhodopirellula solitaria]TWT67476.1 hypothetical protein CA85_23270 [Allorhodopirellula solitaria]
MQLDRTHVAIRVRTLSEIGDLSLVMIRRYPRAFFSAFFAGAAFWIVADLLLLGWLPWRATEEAFREGDASAERFRYLFWMMTLVFLQTPLAGAVSTYLLGQSIFEQQISVSRAIREIRPVFWQLIWVLGIRRMAIPAMVVVAMRWHAESNAFYDVFLPATFVMVVALVRSSRPFVAEMILLERCPLRSKNPGDITLGRRSKALHSPMASELGGRFLTVTTTIAVLLACIFFALLWSRGIALGNWSVDSFAMLVFFPLALWLVASLSVIVKLLGYLDARIRLEGWEVELAIRAEAIRQFGEDSMSTFPSQPTAIRETSVSSTGADARSKTLSLLIAGLVATVSSIGPLQAESQVAMVSVSAAAAETASAPVVADSAWFDSNQGELRSIELRDERVDTENRESRWQATPATAKPKQPKAASSSTSTATMGLNEIVGWTLLIVLVCALAALLLYVFQNSTFDFGNELPSDAVAKGSVLDEQTKQRISELPSELRTTDVSPRAELERLMELGDFDQAIIYLYGHQLLMLDRIGWIRLSRWKTNRQYLREAQQSSESASTPLRHTVAAFEQSYFGKHRLSGEQFQRLWDENLAMESFLAASGGAK